MNSTEQMRRATAVILGCPGTTLGKDERRFFEDSQPLGFILFARNCESPEQVRALVSELKSCVGDDDAPVLVDQEGGRVQRLKPPLWRSYPSARKLVEAARRTAPDHVTQAVYLNARLIADELAALGISVNCMPVLDIPAAGSHAIIGERAYGDTPQVVSEMGDAVCRGLFAGGIMPVIKHIPGHGRAMADSHEQLPTVTAPRGQLSAIDFSPFRSLAHMPWGMTCHLMFPDLDPDNPATQSASIISEIIRKDIGFDGVLCTDDLSMKALGGSYRERTEKALAAGCDLALHCNGEMAEMSAVVEGAGELAGATITRLQRAETLRRERFEPDTFDVEAARARIHELTGIVI